MSEEKLNELFNIIDEGYPSIQEQKIRNYITNLQEEYKKEQYLVDKLTRQLSDEYKNTEYQCKEKEDYKSRCEKAIDVLEELIAEFQLNDYITDFDKKMNKPLNILQGSDKW